MSIWSTVGKVETEDMTVTVDTATTWNEQVRVCLFDADVNGAEVILNVQQVADLAFALFHAREQILREYGYITGGPGHWQHGTT